MPGWKASFSLAGDRSNERIEGVDERKKDLV